MASTALSTSFFAPVNSHRRGSSHGIGLKQCSSPLNSKSLSNSQACKLSNKPKLTTQRIPFTVEASSSNRDGGSNSAKVFFGGLILGGVITGALSCIFAPEISEALEEVSQLSEAPKKLLDGVSQISEALEGVDRKELLRKLPKFIYDEKRALERTRKLLDERIVQLNLALDVVSSEISASNGSNGDDTPTSEVEANM